MIHRERRVLFLALRRPPTRPPGCRATAKETSGGGACARGQGTSGTPQKRIPQGASPQVRGTELLIIIIVIPLPPFMCLR